MQSSPQYLLSAAHTLIKRNFASDVFNKRQSKADVLENRKFATKSKLLVNYFTLNNLVQSRFSQLLEYQFISSICDAMVKIYYNIPFEI